MAELELPTMKNFDLIPQLQIDIRVVYEIDLILRLAFLRLNIKWINKEAVSKTKFSKLKLWLSSVKFENTDISWRFQNKFLTKLRCNLRASQT